MICDSPKYERNGLITFNEDHVVGHLGAALEYFAVHPIALLLHVLLQSLRSLVDVREVNGQSLPKSLDSSFASIN